MEGPKPNSGSKSPANPTSRSSSDVSSPKSAPTGLSLMNSQDPLDLDWQASKYELKERFEYILTNDLLYDVYFLVGKDMERIGAHKLVLSAGSSVFFTTFSQRWSADCNEIKEPEIEPAAFKEMLRFLYSDKISLTPDNVAAVLYVARQYLVQALTDKCIDYLTSLLCPENAFSILIQARKFNLTRLVEACLEVIDDHTLETMEAEDFCKIDLETLLSLLKRSELTISEFELFKAVLRWAEAACKERDLPVNPENKRLVLKNALLLLRFPLMNEEVFAKDVCDSGVLSESEMLSVFRCRAMKSQFSPCVFIKLPRRATNNFTARRFNERLCHTPNEIITYHSLTIGTDRDISLTGIGLYGHTEKLVHYKFDIKIVVAGSGKHVYDTHGAHACNRTAVFPVSFDKAVTLSRGIWYCLEVFLEGEYSLVGTNGSHCLKVVTRNDQQVEFNILTGGSVCHGPKKLRNRSDDNSGQIPKLFFSV